MDGSIDRSACTCESPVCPRPHAASETRRTTVGPPSTRRREAPAAWLVGHRVTAASRRRVLHQAQRSA